MDIIEYFNQLQYLPTGYFAYDASSDVIHYDHTRLNNNEGKLCLLHETSHAILGHVAFSTELELYLMEVSAWTKTRELAELFNVLCDEDYIDDCLNSYDYWLMGRATCPDCNNFCLPINSNMYQCFLCGCKWKVAPVTNHSTRRHRIKDHSNKIPLF